MQYPIALTLVSLDIMSRLYLGVYAIYCAYYILALQILVIC